jgi:hypothetical protein
MYKIWCLHCLESMYVCIHHNPNLHPLVLLLDKTHWTTNVKTWETYQGLFLRHEKKCMKPFYHVQMHTITRILVNSNACDHHNKLQWTWSSYQFLSCTLSLTSSRAHDHFLKLHNLFKAHQAHGTTREHWCWHT